jgi:aminomethyltransferase
VSVSGRQTPLLDLHKRLGGRTVDFAGWEMPLQYEGVVAEHRAVRSRAGVFDVSHLGKLRVRGAGDALQHAVTADVLGLPVGHAKYGLVLTDDAGCVDDIFVYRLEEDEWLVVPNAANVGSVADAIQRSGAKPEDEWDRWAILALQGPSSFDIFEAVFPDSPAPRLKLHQWGTVDIMGAPGIVARTGYTGERGVEVYAPADRSVAVFERFVEGGAVPAGLGARDTLRLEMGYALYGHELTTDINPLEAGLGWAIAWETDFRGRAALAEVKERGPVRGLFGVRCVDRGVPRAGYSVLEEEDREVGRLTSGNYSPTLNCGIGLALGPKAVPARGSRVYVSARGRMIPSDIVKPPFIKR